MMSYASQTVMAAPNPIALIMAGGGGTRFWPLSRKSKPKQFLNLFGKECLLQATIDRISPLIPISSVSICALEDQRTLLDTYLRESPTLISEPTGRNTAPCILLSVLTLLKKGVAPETPMVVLPADHFIADEPGFLRQLESAISFARESRGLILLGIEPTRPHTGYGYIEREANPTFGNIYKVNQFREKPDMERAKEFLAAGKCYWNSGIFCWTLESIDKAFQTYFSNEYKILKRALDENFDLHEAYKLLPSLPIDTAILENAPNVFVLPSSFGWSDIGSWSALHELHSQNKSTNVQLRGNARSLDSTGNLIYLNPDTKLALIGIHDCLIVQEGNEILICARDEDQKVKEISKEFLEN